LGALRRPQPDLERRETLTTPSLQKESQGARVPRWLVASGLIVYCSVFWVLIWAAGSFGIDLVRAATAGAP